MFAKLGKGDKEKQPPPTPNSHEDGKEHSAAIIKQMGHLETQAHEGLLWKRASWNVGMKLNYDFDIFSISTASLWSNACHDFVSTPYFSFSSLSLGPHMKHFLQQ